MNVLITGGSSGLGEAIALQYSILGYNIIITARRLPELERVASKCKAAGAKSVHVVTGDVSKEEDCKAVGQFAATVFPQGLHVLVINAGIGMRARVDEVKDTSIYRRLVDVNTLGAVFMTHYCLPLVIKAKGHVVAISSVSGLFGLPGLAGYCMSKAALHGFFDALRNEGAVGVTVVCPGFMETEMPSKNMSADGTPVAQSDSMDRGHAWSPDYVAATIVAAVAAKKRDVVFDSSIKFALLIRNSAPSVIDYFIKRRFSSHSKL